MSTKISDLIKQAQINNTALTSFEFFCPKTKEGLDNLRLRIKHLKKTIHVSFISLTCTPKTKDFNRTIELASSVYFLFFIFTRFKKNVKFQYYCILHVVAIYLPFVNN